VNEKLISFLIIYYFNEQKDKETTKLLNKYSEYNDHNIYGGKLNKQDLFKFKLKLKEIMPKKDDVCFFELN